MNALVGYDSSSDEDKNGEPVSTLDPSSTPSTTVDESSHPARIEVNAPLSAVSGVTTTGPLLGPSPFTNDIITEADLPPESPGNMSERDAIRYLTQTSVPMTSMPPSPCGSPDPVANARFNQFLQLKAKGVHFNEDLAQKSSFLNPGLLATMMTRSGIDAGDQYNTSLPLDLWNPKVFPKWAYKEELLKSQQAIKDKEDGDKKALSAAGKRLIDFMPPVGESNDPSRRSSPGYQKKRRRP